MLLTCIFCFTPRLEISYSLSTANVGLPKRIVVLKHLNRPRPCLKTSFFFYNGAGTGRLELITMDGQ